MSIFAAIKAIKNARLNQHAIKSEQDKWSEQQQKFVEGGGLVDKSGEALRGEIQAGLKKDLADIEQINAQFTELSSLHWGLKTHKMKEILNGVVEIFSDDVNFGRLVYQGDLPTGHDNTITSLPNHEGGEYWGTSKVTFASGALLSTRFITQAKNMSSIPVYNSPIVQLYSVALNLVLPEGYSYGFSDAKVTNGFCTIASGYAFGGVTRFQDDIYPNGKKFGAEDCASWVEKVIKFPQIVSTADLLAIYRFNKGEGFTPDGWADGFKGSAKFLTPITAEEAGLGDIMLIRKFNERAPEESSLGEGGHVAILLEKPQSDEVLTIAANRDMPHREGIGLENRETAPTNGGKVFYLRVTEELLAKNYPDLAGVEHEPFNLESVVAHYDSECMGLAQGYVDGIYDQLD
jgi:hypothetical protein